MFKNIYKILIKPHLEGVGQQYLEIKLRCAIFLNNNCFKDLYIRMALVFLISNTILLFLDSSIGIVKILFRHFEVKISK